MKEIKFKIGVPQLERAEFTINVNGKKCFVWLNGNGEVEYNKPDFVNVNYYNDVSVCRYALEQIEKLIKESFVKQVLKKKRNARSGKTAHNNKNNAEI